MSFFKRRKKENQTVNEKEQINEIQTALNQTINALDELQYKQSMTKLALHQSYVNLANNNNNNIIVESMIYNGQNGPAHREPPLSLSAFVFQNALKELESVFNAADITFSESEIEDILKIFSEEKLGKERFKVLLRRFVISNHFSEDFLLKYALGKVEVEDLYVLHSPDIKSGEYSSIKLGIEVGK